MILLCVVIVVMGIGALIGYKQGLIKIIASLVAATLIVSLVGAVSPYISKWIQEGTPLKDNIQQKVAGVLLPGETEESEEPVREQQISILENAQLPSMFRQGLLENNNHEVYAMLGVETFSEYIGSYITKIIADALAFLLSFIVVTIGVLVLIKALGLIDKLPLIGGMNRVAGGVLGGTMGIGVIWILFLVITIFYDTEFGRAGFEQIEESRILTYLYEGNIFLKYISRF